MPGLLEGASEGVGLGDEFLAHLERARLFLHVIDVQEDVEARFHAIDRELAAYGAGLAERPQIVVLNKVDLVTSRPRSTSTTRGSSASSPRRRSRAGIDELKRTLFALIPESPPAPRRRSELADFLVYRPQPPRQRRFRIFRTPGGYRVRGEATEEELRAAGVKPDAVVGVRGRVTTGLLGGAFDPPHAGHVVLAEEAVRRFGLDRLLVLVVAEPGHKPVRRRSRSASSSPAPPSRTSRSRRCAAKSHAYTVDSLRAERLRPERPSS